MSDIKIKKDMKKATVVKDIVDSAKDIIVSIEQEVVVKEKDSIPSHKEVIILEGLCCANCAAKIEKKVRKIDGVKEVAVDLASQKLFLEAERREIFSGILEDIKAIVKSIEPDVKVYLHKREKATEENKKESSINKEILQLLAGAVIFAAALLLKISPFIEIPLYFISYSIIGGEVLLRAGRNILKGEVFDENFLMGLATIGAFAIGEYPEAIAVMLFYQIGELFQDMAVDKSRRSIAALMDIRPDYANVKIGDSIFKTSPEDVVVGNIIVVKPGERIPLDGVVIEGESMVDTMALTGESMPRDIKTGDSVLSGFINKNGLLTVEVTKGFEDSTVAKILDLVQNAGSKKAPTENFITKFARYYTPVVVILAALLAFVPPIFVGNLSSWIYRALVFLVVSCPCALVVSIPLGFFGGIAAASKKGILVKGGNYLEALNNLEMVVFDKTGTLTKGVFKVTEITSCGELSKEEILEAAAYGEAFSNHPIANSILQAFDNKLDKSLIESYEEKTGMGIKTIAAGKVILVGNFKLMEAENIKYKAAGTIGTTLHIAVDSIYAGYIIISDEVKEDSKGAISRIKELGVKKVAMLTGDSSKVAQAIGKDLGIDDIYSELLPNEKVKKVEELEKYISSKGKYAFVGDGINDAPVLARADIGIAMGGIGSDAAIEAADVVIMTDEPSKIATAIKVAKKTRTIVIQNIILALGVKIVILALGAMGFATMWEAVFGDVGVALLAVLNAMRCMNVKEVKA